jgi:predicted TIM-barrel fold metal-dependent hydrolase
MIIDGHCHAGPGEGFTGPYDTDAPLGTYLERASRAGITHTVLFAAFHVDYAQANEAVAAIVRQNPRRFSGLAFVHALRDRGRIMQMVSRAVKVHGFRGIKCHRYDARITREICETARALRIPVLYDVMGEVDSVELFAPQYKDVTFIIPHLGSFGDDWKAQFRCIDTMARHPNVVTDSSGIRRFDLLEEAVRRAGPHKLIFGSDGPWLHPGLELAKVKALRLDERGSAMVLRENAIRVFNLRHLAMRVAG